jgi:hypothetical protein
MLRHVAKKFASVFKASHFLSAAPRDMNATWLRHRKRDRTVATMDRSMIQDEQQEENFQTLIADAAALEREIDAILPALASARRNYAKSRSEADRVEMDRVQGLAEDLAARHPALSDDLSRASGLPDEVLEALDAPLASLDSKNRVRRDDLNGAEVRSTGSVDDYLADAIETVERSLPAGWSEAEAGASHRLDALFAGECLSLVKGLRPGSELAPLHRMRQMLRVARDYLADQPAYDHFAGALLVPTLAQLGAHLPSLAQVGGDVSARIGKLAETGGASTDATVLELLVAARCAEMGRRIEFLDETQERSPDIRCHDPFPMQIECKRKRALSDYEIAEEAAMRAVFLALEREASSKGLTGRFDLQLNVEVRSNLTTEIVTRLISQRLAPHPERALHYEWGTVAYHPIPRRVPLPGMTRLYSPNMLSHVFDWDSDIPTWDGLVCRVSGGEAFVDEIRNPIALVWNNSSEVALRRRAWSPLDLFGDAINQITPGEFAIVYLTYHEGARAEIADRRVINFLAKTKDEWYHAASIRVPLSFLIRLYPRALNHGQPDLIESTVPLCSAAYGEPKLADDFPKNVFTNSPGYRDKNL